MRTTAALFFSLISALSAAGTAVCVYYLPSSLREWRDEVRTMVLLILGTIAVALISGLFLRGAFLGFGKVKPRKSLDQLCTFLSALLGIIILVFTIINATKPWPGVILSVTFLFSALAFRWVSKAPVISA